MKGTVKVFFSRPGWGFIRGDDDRDYFVHYKELSEDCIDNPQGRRNLSPGQRVEFGASENERGPLAVGVEPVG